MKSMLKTTLALLALTGLLTSSGQALAAKQVTLKDAQLIIEDNAGMFSADARNKAKAEFAKLKSEYDRQVTIFTIKELTGKDLEDHDKAKKDGNENRFWDTYTHTVAKEDRAKGIFILVCRKPGNVYIIADKLMLDSGFDVAKEKVIRDKFLENFLAAKGKPEAEAQTKRDSALIDVATYLHNNVSPNKANNIRNTTAHSGGSGGMPIWGWVCIGLAVVAVLWVIIGMVRGGGSSGGGGGGGGGGFFTGLLGGMFGAMAGMWMYNNLFGGNSYHDSSYGGDSGGDGGGGETGGGDFSGDSGSGGGWDDGGGGGGGGGGDFGGGGGDF